MRATLDTIIEPGIFMDPTLLKTAKEEAEAEMKDFLKDKNILYIKSRLQSINSEALKGFYAFQIHCIAGYTEKTIV